MTRGNWDESRAKLWLEFQGHTDIRRPCDDPPDYVVEGRYAVEVRRLDRPEEAPERPLHNTVEKVLAEFDPPTQGRKIFVSCDYPHPPPLPDKGKVEREIREALKSNRHLEESRIRLDCGIYLSFCPTKLLDHGDSRFVLNEVSIATAYTGWVLSELKEHIPRCIEEKSRKVRSKDRVDCYCEWWLVLVDYIECAGQLEESELEDLREAVQFKDFWKRVVIISPENPKLYYELCRV